MALANGSIDHTGLAEATTAGATPLNFNRSTIEDNIDIGHNKFGDRFRH